MKSNINMKYKIIVCLFLIASSINAQFSEEYYSLKKKYPNDHSINTNDEVTIDIKLTEGEIEIKESVLEERIYLSQFANFGAKQEINFSSFSDINNLKAASYIFDGKKYIKNEVSDFIESDAQSQSFYDDTKKINFLYKGLSEGVKTQKSYSRSIKNPRFLTSHYFGNLEPIVNTKFTIVVDNSIDIEFKKFGFEKLENVAYNVKKSKKRTTHTWQRKDTDKIDLEVSAPNFRKRLPTIVPIIKSYNYKGETIEVSGSVQNLYNWYYSLVENVNNDSVNTELEKLVLSLTKTKETEIEKVKAIYYWVQENIKYIAFEYALGGFVPREANKVFSQKYGDCKDNSSILKEMLKIAKLNGYLTWIGTRSIPYTYEELPTPAVDNHMILSYITANDEVYYLDATGRYLPLEMPSSFIQGKEALIGIDKNKFKIEKVPFVPAETNKYTDSVFIKINDKKIVGTGKMLLDGYPKIDFFNSLEYIKTDKDKNDFYKSVLEKGSNRCLIDSFLETNKFDYEKPFTVDYNFNIENFVSTYDNEIFVNMNLFEGIDNFKTPEDRKSGKDYQYKSDTKLTSVLEIPSGTTIDFVPKDFNYSQADFKCDITYKIVGTDKIIMTYNILQNFTSLNLEEQQNLNSIIAKVKKKQKDVVVLKKI